MFGQIHDARSVIHYFPVSHLDSWLKHGLSFRFLLSPISSWLPLNLATCGKSITNIWYMFAGNI